MLVENNTLVWSVGAWKEMPGNKNLDKHHVTASLALITIIINRLMCISLSIINYFCGILDNRHDNVTKQSESLIFHTNRQSLRSVLSTTDATLVCISNTFSAAAFVLLAFAFADGCELESLCFSSLSELL